MYFLHFSISFFYLVGKESKKKKNEKVGVLGGTGKSVGNVLTRYNAEWMGQC